MDDVGREQDRVGDPAGADQVRLDGEGRPEAGARVVGRADDRRHGVRVVDGAPVAGLAHPKGVAAGGVGEVE